MCTRRLESVGWERGEVGDINGEGDALCARTLTKIEIQFVGVRRNELDRNGRNRK